jgi:hypothetical protein
MVCRISVSLSSHPSTVPLFHQSTYPFADQWKGFEPEGFSYLGNELIELEQDICERRPPQDAQKVIQLGRRRVKTGSVPSGVH